MAASTRKEQAFYWVDKLFRAIRETKLTPTERSSHVEEAIQFLKNLEINLSTIDAHGYTPLMFAVQLRQLDIAKLLLEKGNTNPNVHNRVTGQTALMCAAATDQPDMIRLLVDAKADIDAVDFPYMCSALHFATAVGATKSTELLLELKANPNIRNDNQLTPFPETVEASELVQARKTHTEALFEALENTNLKPEERVFRVEKAIRFLKESKLDISYIRNEISLTPLMVAAYYNYSDVVKSLLNQKSDPNVYNMRGQTALIIAAARNHADIIRTLVIGGAKIDAPESKEMNTPLHYASFSGHIESTKLLLELNANPNLKNRDQKVPKTIASLEASKMPTLEPAVSVDIFKVLEKLGMYAYTPTAKEGLIYVGEKQDLLRLQSEDRAAAQTVNAQAAPAAPTRKYH